MSGAALARFGPVSPGRPDWKRGPQVEFSFSTTVVTARNGSEQRSALRNTARIAMTVEILAWGAELHRLKADLADDLLARFYWATAWRQTALSVDTAASTAGTIELTVVPFWVVPRCHLVLRSLTTNQTSRVASVVGSVVTLDSPLAVDMVAGDKVYHAYLAPFEEEVSFKATTAGMYSGAVTAAVTPGSDPQPVPPLTFEEFEGDAVFPHKPNWRDRPQIKVGHMRETFDTGSGLIDEFSPTGYSYLDLRFLFSAVRASDVEKVVGFWLAAKGKRGQFRLPTFVQDFDVTQAEGAGSSVFRVRGAEFYAAYQFSDVYNVVAARRGDGTLEVRRIASMEIVDGDTEITFTAPWGGPIDQNTRLHWCPLARFGSDKLKVSWDTAELADLTMTFKVLREEV